MAVEQLAISGQAGYPGIPTCTVTWTGVGGSHVASCFTEVAKNKMADKSQAEGNDGEVATMRRRNVRIQLRFSARAVAADAAAAQAIGADLPWPDDTCTIACTDDPEVATSGTSIVDDASARYTPDGDLMIDFTITNWIGKTFVDPEA